jgi:GDP-4-dehydro-6-deoxy-D-mannose reductase
MRCLITGATGFVGRHLAAALREAGHEVVGLARRRASLPITLHLLDLIDVAAVASVLRAAKPEWIFHLAGFANPKASFSDPDAAWAGNLGATRGLFDAVVRSGLRPRILCVSSGLVYGDAGPGGQDCTEETPLRPASPYAVSKAAADLLAYQQFRQFGLDVVRVRPFNQIGPGQSADYSVASFARQIAAIEQGVGDVPPVVFTRDLSGQRDFTDVRDMVRAYIRLLEVGRAGEVYNAGSGTTYLMREVLNRLIARSRVPSAVEERGDPARAGDTVVSRADIRKLRASTGWGPAISLDRTLEDMLADWRGRVA